MTVPRGPATLGEDADTSIAVEGSPTNGGQMISVTVPPPEKVRVILRLRRIPHLDTMRTEHQRVVLIHELRRRMPFFFDGRPFAVYPHHERDDAGKESIRYFVLAQSRAGQEEVAAEILFW